MRTPSLSRATSTSLALVLILAAGFALASAQTSTRPTFPLAYVLAPESRYEEGCFAPCMCLVHFSDEVKGGFTLSFSAFEPPFIVYDVQDIQWFARTLGRTFTGSGRYRIGWRGTAQQQLQVDLSDNGAAPVRFDSGLVPVKTPFPRIDVAISVNGFFCYDKAFYLKAGPVRPVIMSVQVDPTLAPESSVSWDMFPDAPAYDIAYGSVNTLRATGGDFTAATSGCLGSDVASSPADGGATDPPAGEAFWYLVRARGGVAGSTYDAGDPGQGGTCDAQIDAAPVACP